MFKTVDTYIHTYTHTYIHIGAGIGRITEGLLIHMFKTVDLVEPVEQLLNKAKENLAQKNAEHFYLLGLQVHV